MSLLDQISDLSHGQGQPVTGNTCGIVTFKDYLEIFVLNIRSFVHFIYFTLYKMEHLLFLMKKYNSLTIS